MFELSVALKYLIPKRKQLSVSIISIISILVIALVVWLILLFFSVKNGLEKTWVDKLVSLTAPIRITPTEAYYRSYYYLIDGISGDSDYTTKSLAEKLAATKTDPYNPDVDQEVDPLWMPPDLNPDGSLKDLVKLAFNAVNELPVKSLTSKEYEVTFSNVRLRLLRQAKDQTGVLQSTMNQGVYLGSFDQQNKAFSKTLVPLSTSDISNVIEMSGISAKDAQNDHPDQLVEAETEEMRKRLGDVFDRLSIGKLKTPKEGWKLPKALYPKEAEWQAIVFSEGQQVRSVLIPADATHLEPLMRSFSAQNFPVKKGTVSIRDGTVTLVMEDGKSIKNLKLPLVIEGEYPFRSELIKSSITKSVKPGDLQFKAWLNIQRTPIEGMVRLENLEPAEAAYHEHAAHPYWVYKEEDRVILPHDPALGDGVILPKNFREAGVLVGDRGYLSYMSPTTSSMQEQRIPIYVAGFYDHGIMPIGGKFMFVNPEVVTLLRTTYDQNDHLLGTGINVRFDDLDQTDAIKSQLEQAFKAKGIDKYWKIETYRDFEFAKDLLQQLNSEKNLFSLISMVIIIVACSNIVSMLIILVNDKRVEIGILRAMGASSFSIAAIFGLCGIIMGLLGSLIGIGLALITLYNLQALIDFIGRVQGYQVFNSMFYGDILPNELSYEALGFVMLTTVGISLISGIVPAVKASLMKPSAILRSE